MREAAGTAVLPVKGDPMLEPMDDNKELEIVPAAAVAKLIPMPVTSMIADVHRMLVVRGCSVRDSAEYVRLFDLGTGRSSTNGHSS